MFNITNSKGNVNQNYNEMPSLIHQDRHNTSSQIYRHPISLYPKRYPYIHKDPSYIHKTSHILQDRQRQNQKIASVGQYMEKLAPLCTVEWECKTVQLLWKTVWRQLKKLKIEPPYDPGIPHLGIYTKELKTKF